MLLPSRRSLIGQEGLAVYQTGDVHPTGDGWILGLAGRISHLIGLGTVLFRLGTVLTEKGTYRKQMLEVKESQEDLSSWLL